MLLIGVTQCYRIWPVFIKNNCILAWVQQSTHICAQREAHERSRWLPGRNFVLKHTLCWICTFIWLDFCALNLPWPSRWRQPLCQWSLCFFHVSIEFGWDRSLIKGELGICWKRLQWGGWSRLAGLHLISIVKSREEGGRNSLKLGGWACKNDKEKKPNFCAYYA